MPEPLVQPDGTDKHDGERHAATRLGAKRRQAHPHLQGIVTADSLSSHAPHSETLHDHALHSILGGKESDPAWLFQQVQAAEHAGRVIAYERHDRAAGRGHRCRFVHDVPLTASHAEVRGHCIESWERSADKVQPCSWGTDWRVRQRTVLHLMRGGRARWKSEHETCQTLKNPGDHFEHTYGHGAQNLSVVCATLMLLACLVDHTQQLCCAVCRAVWAKRGSKRLLWERMRAWCDEYALKSMRQLLETLFDGLQKLQPLWAVDAS